jgi:two-component system, LytTR family, sensor kinase
MFRKLKIKKYIEPAIHIIIWGSLFLALWLIVRTMGPFRRQDGTIFPPLIWSAIANLILFYFNAIILVPRFVSKHSYGEYILYVFILFAIVVLANSFLDFSYAISIRSSEKEPFWSEVMTNSQSKILILTMSIGYSLTRNWIKSEQTRQQLMRDKLDAELKVLKAQINPHFLFNTLNMAYASAVKSTDNVTADIIERLSVLMRYVLYESNEDKVSLEKEISYIDNYVNLQLQRLSDEIASQVKYQAVGTWHNLMIAPMILIPFIENTFKHGIMLSTRPDISISISLNNNILVLETRNLKNNFSSHPDKPATGIGLNNVKERLKLIYPGSHKLEITDINSIFHVRLELQL